MRWRGPGCGGDLGARLVSEDSTQLFEEEALGVPPMYSQASITELEVVQAKLELHHQLFSHSKWCYGAEGVTRMFGYTFGYQICKNCTTSTCKRSSELVSVETRDVLAAQSSTNPIGSEPLKR